MQASDAMEHGRWMKALIQETKMASLPADATDDDVYDDVLEPDDNSCSSFSERGQKTVYICLYCDL